MKRGFLNTARSKRLIEEAYAPQSPPSGRPKPSDRPSQLPTRNASRTPSLMPRLGDSCGPNGPEAAAAHENDAMDVGLADEMPTVTALQEVYADGRVVAVRITRSINSGSEAGDPSTPPSCHAQDCGGEVVSVQDMVNVRMMEFQDVYADGRIVGVHVIRSGVDGTKTPLETRKDDRIVHAESYSAAKDPEGTSKEKVIDVDHNDTKNTSRQDNPIVFLPPRALRRNPPGLGRHPDEEFFHTVPPRSYSGPRRKRTVFRVWPRPLNGQPIDPIKSHKGTVSPDGYPWAATLYDVFYVSRFPEVPGLMSIMTGSAIREAVEAIGEPHVSVREFEWSKSESKPRVEGATSTEELIKCLDRKRHLSSLDARGGMEMEQDGGEDEEDFMEQAPTEDDDGDEDTKIPFLPLRLLPFHPDHDPKLHSFTPFENEPSILLRERIPLYLLPQTLYVHDPFYLLTVCKQRFSDTSWTSRPDIVRTYNLHLSETARKERKDERQKVEELEEFKARTLIILRYQRTEEQIQNCEPMIEVLLPPHPRRPTKVEESHLYLSPVAKVGKGHHSVVYKGEWELPRDIFMKQRICSPCFKESVDKEVQRLKDIGRWDKVLRAASWGPNGFTGRQLDLDEINDLIHIEMEEENIEREIICIIPSNADPSKIVEMIDQTNIWDKLMKKRKVHSTLLDFTGDKLTKDPHVAVVRVEPPFSYESQKSCTHRFFRAPVSRSTAIFNVAAKLSFKDDPHLDREANNYQMFPKHFFEHYDGYTVISRLHAIVPVHAIVPQFYGYYVPEMPRTRGLTPEGPGYLSRILLLEHCGEPIDPGELSPEDQEECVSLLMRFQRSGWLHESVATRNFLVQRGKPTEFPLTRTFKPELSFRLIDFGRSRKSDKVYEKQAEEMEALDIFDKLSDSLIMQE